jgi:hypothetical protein
VTPTIDQRTRSALAAVATKNLRASTAVAVASLLAMSGLLSGCSPTKEEVCPKVAEHVMLVPSTSVSDLDTSRSLSPDVAKQAVARSADTCGRLTVGLQNNKTEADLELQHIDLVPKRKQAFNRTPVIRKLVKQGETFASDKLLDPLGKVSATGGSPFLGALAKTAAELDAHGGAPATVILLGDGIDVEPTPSGGGVIDFRRAVVPRERLDEFVPLLKGLEGSCVMLVGAGAASNLPGERIRAAQRMLGQTLEKAGVGFVATRSRDLPTTCRGAAR